MSDPIPRFQHDCTACVFLGRQGNEDVYYCRQGGVRDTIIFRFGDDGPDYRSGWDLNGELTGARIAALQGVIGGQRA